MSAYPRLPEWETDYVGEPGLAAGSPAGPTSGYAANPMEYPAAEIANFIFTLSSPLLPAAPPPPPPPTLVLPTRQLLITILTVDLPSTHVFVVGLLTTTLLSMMLLRATMFPPALIRAALTLPLTKVTPYNILPAWVLPA
ncbi:hypothetical protein K449DRAFT_45876 [Hypoxylon sp. EC38]|nr:hypothetical protein K449DRAFT_45876 [Hypoxylon sp. EC38]